MNSKSIHKLSLTLTKLADGLLDPKLVLAWLMAHLGAGAFLVGLLVPIREAGALLPQLFLAPRVRQTEVRKWWWIIGSFIQGLSVLGIVVSALFLEGYMAGLAIVLLLAVLSLARSASSVSYKDVLGKTVEKSFRGDVTGTASSVAAIGVFIFGLLILSDIYERFWLVVMALMLAGVCWLVAAFNFTRLQESKSSLSSDGSSNLIRNYVQYLKGDKELVKFIVTRALLVSTAIAPPFLILLVEEVNGSSVIPLGALILASSLATAASGKVWGKLSDKSTKLVLSFAGLAASLVLFVSVLLAVVGLIAEVFYLSSILFVLMVSYQGVRIARVIHLVNLADEDTRAVYTAISNTIIGLVLLATGLFGSLSLLIGLSNTVLVLASMSLLGGLSALTLKEEK